MSAEYADATRRLESVIGPLPRSSEAVRTTEDRFQVPTYTKRPFALVRGEGLTVWDAEGRAYLDLYGGHCVAVAGHNPPELVTALKAQAERLLFYSNAVYVDVRAVAAEALAGLAPKGLQHVFLCNSGAEANETALKVARKATGRRIVVSMNEGFHGRTLGALGATGLPKYRDPAYPVPTEHRYVPFGDVAALEAVLDADVAAVMLEPIPSMGGIYDAPPAYHQALRELTRKNGSLLIHDEVQTGFGRTGTWFYGQGVGVTPDLITSAKGVAGGFPAGVCFLSDALAAGIRSGDQGTTFGGGPLASVAIAAVARILTKRNLAAHAAHMGAHLRERLAQLAGVTGIEGKGLLVGIDLDRPAAPVVRELIDMGIITGTSGKPNQIRLLPPLTIDEAAVERLREALDEILSRPEGSATA